MVKTFKVRSSKLKEKFGDTKVEFVSLYDYKLLEADNANLKRKLKDITEGYVDLVIDKCENDPVWREELKPVLQKLAKVILKAGFLKNENKR